jgi:DNA-binding CsgD family transcriptional regulator
MADISAELFGFKNFPGGGLHQQFELMAVIVLVLSLVFTGRAIRNVMIRQRRIEAQLRVASGAFVEVLDMHFDIWSLTPSERDVALLAIQGRSIAEIARLRQTKEGTVKAQCNAIYGKAGVSGRPQLLSLFIEELLGDGLLRQQTAGP